MLTFSLKTIEGRAYEFFLKAIKIKIVLSSDVYPSVMYWMIFPDTLMSCQLLSKERTANIAIYIALADTPQTPFNHFKINGFLLYHQKSRSQSQSTDSHSHNHSPTEGHQYWLLCQWPLRRLTWKNWTFLDVKVTNTEGVRCRMWQRYKWKSKHNQPQQLFSLSWESVWKSQPGYVSINQIIAADSVPPKVRGRHNTEGHAFLYCLWFSIIQKLKSSFSRHSQMKRTWASEDINWISNHIMSWPRKMHLPLWTWETKKMI